MVHVIAVVAVLALGFGLGRVKHPANLKLANVKAEIAKIESEFTGGLSEAEAKAKSIVARVKALL